MSTASSAFASSAASTPTIKNHTATRLGNELFVFGGYDGGRSLNDLFRFDMSSSEWAQVRVSGVPCEGCSVVGTRRIELTRPRSTIRKAFDLGLVCGDEVDHKKPAPDVYRMACERLGCAPEDCIALSSSASIVLAAALIALSSFL